MKKFLSLSLFLLTLAINVSSQNKNFKVFYSQGSAFIITGDQKKAVRKDMLISEGQTLQLEKNTSIILIAPDGKAFPLSEAGNYPFKNLLLLLDENDKSLTTRYLTYVVQEMTESHEMKEGKLTGGVYRGEMLMLMPPDSCLVIQNNIKFSWVKESSSEFLFLGIWDKTVKKIFSSSFSDTIYNYELKHENEDLIYEWTLGNEPEFSSNIASRTFTIASLATIERLNNELTELEKNLNLQPELNKLMLLNFYERNHLYLEEYNAINEAIILYPENTLIQEYYKWFLQKYGE